jgi:hypothetical protein
VPEVGLYLDKQRSSTAQLLAALDHHRIRGLGQARIPPSRFSLPPRRLILAAEPERGSNKKEWGAAIRQICAQKPSPKRHPSPVSLLDEPTTVHRCHLATKSRV